MKSRLAVTVVTSVGVLGSLGMPAARAEIFREGQPATAASAHGDDRAAGSEVSPGAYDLADRDGDDGGDDNGGDGGHRKGGDDKDGNRHHRDNDGNDDGHD